MARSRYAGNEVIDGAYATWRNPVAEDTLGPRLIDGLQVLEHTVQVGERLDHIAFRYWGDAEYYWVIALANDIQFPLGIAPGTKLQVPVDIRSALDKLQR